MAVSILKSALIWLILSALSASAQSCRQALVLGLDVSLSVNTIDFRLQREGLARALTDSEVMAAMLDSSGSHVELAVFEWTGQFNQNLLIDWTVIDSPETLAQIADVLRQKPQGMRSGRTGLGAAMLYAHDILQTRAHCAAHTLDLSGDGLNNNGIQPELVRGRMDAAGIVVNGLVIEQEMHMAGGSARGLSLYFQDRVIVGPLSFVETIFGFEDYEAAIKRKLLRELAPSLAEAEPEWRGWRVAGRAGALLPP